MILDFFLISSSSQKKMEEKVRLNPEEIQKLEKDKKNLKLFYTVNTKAQRKL